MRLSALGPPFSLWDLCPTQDVTIFPPTLYTQAPATAVFTCPTKCGELGEVPWGFHRPLLAQLEHGYTTMVLSFTWLDVPPEAKPWLSHL